VKLTALDVMNLAQSLQSGAIDHPIRKHLYMPTTIEFCHSFGGRRAGDFTEKELHDAIRDASARAASVSGPAPTTEPAKVGRALGHQGGGYIAWLRSQIKVHEGIIQAIDMGQERLRAQCGGGGSGLRSLPQLLESLVDAGDRDTASACAQDIAQHLCVYSQSVVHDVKRLNLAAEADLREMLRQAETAPSSDFGNEDSEDAN